MNYGKSRVPKSPHFEQILENYTNFGSSMGHQQFLDKYIKDVDPNITLRMWRDFTKKLQAHADIKIQKAITVYSDKKVTEAEMEENSIRKVLSIAEVSLDEVMKDPSMLSAIPMKDRMNWFFQVMKAQNTRAIIKIKAHEEGRKTGIVEDAIRGAQYGEIEEDAIEGEFEEMPPEKPKPVETEKPKDKKAKTVEFNPNDL